jgi:hypothetical protein
LEAVEDGAANVGHEAGKIDDAAIPTDQRRKHWPIRVSDQRSVRGRSRRKELVTRNDEPDARLPDDANVADTHRTEDAKVLRPQKATCFEQNGASCDILSASADVLARRNGVERGDCRG